MLTLFAWILFYSCFFLFWLSQQKWNNVMLFRVLSFTTYCFSSPLKFWLVNSCLRSCAHLRSFFVLVLRFSFPMKLMQSGFIFVKRLPLYAVYYLCACYSSYSSLICKGLPKAGFLFVLCSLWVCGCVDLFSVCSFSNIFSFFFCYNLMPEVTSENLVFKAPFFIVQLDLV